MSTRPTMPKPRTVVARRISQKCSQLMSAMDDLETLLLVNPESRDPEDLAVMDLSAGQRRQLMRNIRLLRHNVQRQQDEALRALM